jgi:hypothetical protein
MTTAINGGFYPALGKKKKKTTLFCIVGTGGPNHKIPLGRPYLIQM